MNKGFIKQQKQQLEEEKKKLTRELKSFAKKDPKLKGNWRTRFPFFDLGGASKDENAEEVEEYEKLLSIEHTLELRLKDVDEALAKLKRGNYGYCEKCRKEIESERLKLVPEAKLCLKCSRKKEA